MEVSRRVLHRFGKLRHGGHDVGPSRRVWERTLVDRGRFIPGSPVVSCCADQQIEGDKAYSWVGGAVLGWPGIRAGLSVWNAKWNVEIGRSRAFSWDEAAEMDGAEELVDKLAGGSRTTMIEGKNAVGIKDRRPRSRTKLVCRN